MFASLANIGHVLLLTIILRATNASDIEYDVDDFYRNIEYSAPEPPVIELLGSLFANPVKVGSADNPLPNPCCPQHTSRFVCDPSCQLDQDEIDELTKVAFEIITGSGCSCKKVKYCTMQENGFRVFIVIVPNDFVRNVTSFLENSPPPIYLSPTADDQNKTQSLYELISKHVSTKPGETLLDWLARTIRLFVWQNGRCDDDVVLTVLHEHQNSATVSFAPVEIMMPNVNKVSWSAGSAIMNQSSISDHCLDEVFEPIRDYLHKPQHRRLSVRLNDTSSHKFAESLSRSLTRLFKAINRRDDLDNPCFVHQDEEEDKTASSQQWKLLAFAGIVSVVLPVIGCIFVALGHFLSKRYCTEDPNKSSKKKNTKQDGKHENATDLENPSQQPPNVQCGSNRQLPRIMGNKRLHLIPTSPTYTISNPICSNLPDVSLRVAEENDTNAVSSPPPCRPQRYYCGSHKHRLIYRYYNTVNYYQKDLSKSDVV